MISKIAPLIVMGMAAQSFYNKGKKGEKMEDKQRSKSMEKAVMKKKMGKSCSSCGGKGCSKCASGSVGQGKYK